MVDADGAVGAGVIGSLDCLAAVKVISANVPCSDQACE